MIIKFIARHVEKRDKNITTKLLWIINHITENIWLLVPCEVLGYMPISHKGNLELPT